MRTLTTAQTNVLKARSGYATHARLWVKDFGGTYRDLTSLEGRDWVKNVTYSEDIDSPVMGLEAEISRDAYNLSLAPLRSTSKLYTGYGSSPILDVGRSIKLEVATVPLATTKAQVPSGDWQNVFEGYIDEVDPGSETIRVVARDFGARLQDSWIETDGRVYSSGGATQVKDVIQGILDDNGFSSVVVWEPSAISWALKPFKQDRMSVQDAIQRLATQFAGSLRYRWDSGTSAWRLKLYEPDRAKTTPDYTLETWQYLDITECSATLSRVRNAIRVIYSDSADLDEQGQAKRKTLEVTDSASITKYGRRFFEICEDDSSQIDTSAEATKLANGVLNDLKEPLAVVNADLPYFWPGEVGDLYRFSANSVHFDVQQDLAVVAISHSLPADGMATTSLTLRGKPAAASTVWLEKGTGAGVAPVQDLWALTGPGAPSGSGEIGGANIDTSAAQNYKNAHSKNQSSQVYAGTSSGFTPDASTYKGTIKGGDKLYISNLTPGTTYYIKSKTKDKNGNLSAASAATAVTSKYVEVSDVQPQAKVGAQATRTSDDSTMEAGADKELKLNVENYDNGSIYDNTTYLFTASSAGKYRFQARVQVSGIKPGEKGFLWLKKNGTTEVAKGPTASGGISAESGGATVLDMTLDATLVLSASDTIGLRLTTVLGSFTGQSTPSTITVKAGSILTIQKVLTD